jgi:simple sugar transport system permease protein
VLHSLPKSPQCGFTAIIIAWLSNLSAPVIAVVSILIAALEQGSQAIQIKLQIPAAVASIIQV